MRQIMLGRARALARSPCEALRRRTSPTPRT